MWLVGAATGAGDPVADVAAGGGPGGGGGGGWVFDSILEFLV